jgi:site-specific recombinase XerC
LFFDYLVKEHGYPENPIKRLVSRPKQLLPPAPNFMPDILKVNAYLQKRIADASTSKEKLQFMRNQVLFILIYQCGLSVSQLGPLERSHFLNLDTDELRVLIQPPRRSSYSIPINGKYAALIRNYFATLSVEQVKDKIEFPQIFFNSNSFKLISGGISPRGIEDIFKRISSATEVAMTPKSLRQSAVFRWIKEKHPLVNIKEWMGVAPSYNFSLYSQFTQNHAEQMQQFEDLPLLSSSELH